VLLVLVPRHPERIVEVEGLVAARGWTAQRFSQQEQQLNDTQILLGDTLGDMTLYYSLADVAFGGGSLVPTGCQNIIEPAALGLPVVTGPSLYNFQKVSELLTQAGGMQVVNDAGALGDLLRELLQDQERRAVMGQKAEQEVQRNQGASGRLSRMLSELLAASDSTQSLTR